MNLLKKKKLLFVYEALVKLVLEVFGAGGAIWGFSEVLTLRTSKNIHIWRHIASIIAILFFIRWIFYIHRQLKGMENNYYINFL